MSTIKSSREIDSIFRDSRRVAHPLVIALIAKTPEGRGHNGRVAFIAGKKLGPAVHAQQGQAGLEGSRARSRRPLAGLRRCPHSDKEDRYSATTGDRGCVLSAAVSGGAEAVKGFLRRLAILPRQGAMLLIRGYKALHLSPVPPACRFTPSCSTYALTSIERYGVFKGGWLAAKRIGRCHPWSPGGHDPVP